MSFKYPSLLFLIFLIPPAILYYIYTFKRYKSGLPFPSIKIFKRISTRRFSSFLSHMLFALKMFSIALLVIASARPQGKLTSVEKKFETIDIMCLIDISRSMNIIDIDGTSRFDTARDVIKKFILKSKTNRIGLIAFSGESYTLVPLTTDYGIINSFLDELEIGDLKDGTAIGLALASASDRLKNSKSKNKVAILLTDGTNNAGSISPNDGMMMAKALNIRIYTIGIGTTGKVTLRNEIVDSYTGKKRYTYLTVTSTLNTSLLEKIALTTGGRFYRVFTRDKLTDVYDEINKLEKTEIKFKTFEARIEYYKHFVLPAILLLLSLIFIENVLLRVTP